MAQTPLFRKVALERLSSPEQLDQLTTITNARGWVALAGFGVLLLTAVVWGVAGSIPERVSGTGMLLKSGGVLEVVSAAGGRVVDVSVQVGDSVRAGQVVARVEQAELADQLQQAETSVANLRADHAGLVAFSTRDAALQRTYLAQQRKTAEDAIASGERTLAWLAEKIAAQEQLVQQGLLTRATLATTRQQHDAAREKLAQSHSELTQLAARLLALGNGKQDELRASTERMRQAESRVAELTRQLQASSEVVSPYNGRILEVMAEQGGIVGRGEPVLSLDMTGRTVKGLEAVIYVPPSHGKQIRPGMTIQIAPSTVKQEEYGLMLGKVTYVSDFPATPRGMQRVLKNQQLVQALAGGSAPYEVHADLIVDPETVSQYRWSSSKGPPLRIQSGTLAVGNIEIASRRPVAMVIPLLREYSGL